MQGEEVLTSCPSRCRILQDPGVGGFTVPERPLAGGCARTQERRMVLKPLAFVDRCLVDKLVDPRLASIQVGLGVSQTRGHGTTHMA
jgi:hypothetical protein